MPISIIIPTKNRPGSLVAAVKSARAALPAGGEIIVVDDGSKIPAGEALAGHIGAETTVIDNLGQWGPSAARNAGLRQTIQPIVLFLDDDDLLISNYCRRVLRIARDHADVTYGWTSHIQKRTGRHDRQLPRPKHIVRTGKLDSTIPLRHKFARTTGQWVRRGVLFKLGGFNEAMRFGEDGELCIRLVTTGNMWLDAEPGFIADDTDAKEWEHLPQDSRQQAFGRFRYLLDKHDDLLEEYDPWLERAYRRRMWKHWLKMQVRGLFDRLQRGKNKNNQTIEMQDDRWSSWVQRKR